MTAVLHTWGSDLKYHVHAHCLVTFGGLSSGPQPEWHWPKRKYKLAPFRKLSGVFRAVFLAGLKRLMDKGEVAYHCTFSDVEAEAHKKRWVVNHGRPTADTKAIEQYLGRYICRIGISNKRLYYDKAGKNVRIEYNDYRQQQQGQAAPKAYRNLPPLVAMQQFLQHQLPAYFQRVRHYGLHASATYNKYQAQLPGYLKRNGHTVRTIFQILRALLAQQPYQCEHCGGTDFDVAPVSADRHYLAHQILRKPASGPHHGRSPPDSQASAVGTLK